MKALTEQIYDELNAQVVRMLNHSLNQASRIVELETQLKDHSAQAFSIGETYANALSRIAELEAQLAAQAPVREVPGWVSVNDKLPELRIDVVVYCGYMVTAQRTDDLHDPENHKGWVIDFDNGRATEITHWLPLPAAPVQQEGA